MAVRQTGLRRQKKIDYEIVAPKEFGNPFLGTTLSYTPSGLVGRTLKVSLSELANDPKKQNVHLYFRIINVKEKTAHTEIFKFEVSSSYLKRLIRKERKKIDDSFACSTKDGVTIRVKPMVLTRERTHKSVLKSLRRESKSFLIALFKDQNYNDILSSLMSNTVQRSLRDAVKRIYPVANCEIRIFEKVK